MKSAVNAIIFGIAIIVSSFFLGKAYVEKSKKGGTIKVTGLGKSDFSSDLIVWEANFKKENRDLQQAYEGLKEDKKIIESYLVSKGLPLKSLVFSAVNSSKTTKSVYSESGKYLGSEFSGYVLAQSVQIESNDVEKVENISREITELLNKGIQLYSESPRYYYTKLADLKIEMISRATEDAHLRAQKIAEFSNGKIAKLKSAKMGIFQITGQNSKETYSWGGTFNTSSKEKTASITMKLVYDVK